MFASLSPSDAGALAPRAVIPSYIRSKSEIRAQFRRARSLTRVADLYQAGCCRLMFPSSGKDCQGVIVNTAGGMTGGDETSWSYTLEDGARVSLATQSAEKIYRSDGDPARAAISIKMGKRSHLAWVPQEVILFNGANFSRTLDIDMEEGAKLTLLEISIFGRREKGEILNSGAFHDRWVVRRQGKVAFAENVKLTGDIAAMLDVPAIGGGACAVATLLHVAPDAEKRLARARRALMHATSECGASTWDGMLVARFVSRDALSVRRDAANLASRLLPDGLPRIWSF